MPFRNGYRPCKTWQFFASYHFQVHFYIIRPLPKSIAWIFRSLEGSHLYFIFITGINPEYRITYHWFQSFGSTYFPTVLFGRRSIPRVRSDGDDSQTIKGASGLSEARQIRETLITTDIIHELFNAFAARTVALILQVQESWCQEYSVLSHQVCGSILYIQGIQQTCKRLQ